MADQELVDLRRALDDYVRRAGLRNRIYGVLGRENSDGSVTVDVSSRDGYGYVRLAESGYRTVAICRLEGVSPLPNLPVWMIQEGSELVAKGIDFAQAVQNFGQAAQMMGVPRHAHVVGSGLEYEHPAELLREGRVKPSSGMVVRINPFGYWYDGGYKIYPGGTIDLTSYAPATSGNHAWVLVGIDPSDKSEVAVTGDEYSYGTPLTRDLLEDISFAGYIPLFAVKVREDDTSLENLALYQYAGVIGGSISGTGGGHTIQDDGGALTTRTGLDFSGTTLRATDDATNDKTIVRVGWEVDYSALIPSGKDAFIAGTVWVESGGTLTVEGDLYIL